MKDRLGNNVNIGDEVVVYRSGHGSKPYRSRAFVRRLREDRRGRLEALVDDGDREPGADGFGPGWTAITWAFENMIIVRRPKEGSK
jgi:hypothetical protein